LTGATAFRLTAMKSDEMIRAISVESVMRLDFLSFNAGIHSLFPSEQVSV